MASEAAGVAGGLGSAARSGSRRMEVLTVYAVGLFQGLSLVAFPAAATHPDLPAGYDLSKSRYGLLFLPQVIMAITGSLALPTLARRFGLKTVLLAGIVADTVAMACWWPATPSAPTPSPIRCCWSPPPRSASGSVSP